MGAPAGSESETESDDEQLDATLLALYTEPSAATSRERLTLTSLPAEVLLNIFRWLAAADLAYAACSCRALRRAADEPSHWRRLFTLRWHARPTAALAGTSERRSWKRLFFETDAEEGAVAAADERPGSEMRVIFTQMLVAKRSEAPTRASLQADANLGAAGAAAAVPGRAGAASAVASWRRAHGVGDGRFHSDCGCCFGCTFQFLCAGEVAVCCSSGRAHACDDACLEEHLERGETSTVCGVTGRVRSHVYDLNDAPEEEPLEAQQADDDGGGGFLPGAFGRAYASGYECSSEKELREAMWGSRKPRWHHHAEE